MFVLYIKFYHLRSVLTMCDILLVILFPWLSVFVTFYFLLQLALQAEQEAESERAVLSVCTGKRWGDCAGVHSPGVPLPVPCGCGLWPQVQRGGSGFHGAGKVREARPGSKEVSRWPVVW